MLDGLVVDLTSDAGQNVKLSIEAHTDNIGSNAANIMLGLDRARAVRDYLVSQGVDKAKIETLGMGKTQPVPGVRCEQKNRKELIACLQPHRRVEVEVKGEMTTK
jgi:OOP family OmpA-OmpF porin